MDASMVKVSADLLIPMAEMRFRTTRSGGPGGQNVNKLETRVELLFDVVRSTSLSEKQRELLLFNLKSKIDAGGVLRIVSQESRSQWKNKQDAIAKLIGLLQRALKPRKKRVRTLPSKTSKEQRFLVKKLIGKKKKMRRVVISDE